MSKMEDDSIVQAYHAEYCRQTGREMACSISLYYHWGLFSREFKQEDIKTVVDHLRKIYKANPSILRSCLRWSWLIQERSHFRDLLPEAKAEARKPQPSEKDKFMASIGKPVAVRDNVKTPAQILAGGIPLPRASGPHSPHPDETAVPPSPIEDGSEGFMKEYQEWKKRLGK